jgi:hypothetical protein
MNYKTSIAWSFGSSKKKAECEIDRYCETPGPGKYENPKGAFLLNRSVSYSFGKKHRFDMKNKFTPGPGSYNTYNNHSNHNNYKNYIAKRGPSYTIKKATNSFDLFPQNDCLMFYGIKKKLECPSPNQYSIDANKLDISKKKNPSFKFSQARKDINYENHIPGPGAYKTESLIDKTKSKFPKWTINKSSKDDIWIEELKKSSNSNIGPGKYEKPSLIGLGPKVT